MTAETIKFGLFAYELVRHVADFNNWSSVMLRHYESFVRDSYFDKNIGDAIHFIIDRNGDHIYDCYMDLDEESDDPKKQLTYVALDAFPAYFPEGYTPGHFLSFCAILIGVAIMYLDSYELDKVLDGAAEVVQSILTYFTLISDFNAAEDMPELIRVSRHICRKLRHGAKK